MKHKRIEGTDDIYVTDNGTIYRIINNGKLYYKARINNCGYERVRIKYDRYKEKLVHRLVAESFVENPHPIKYKIVNHIDGNKLNNHYTNLEWCNNKMNMQHAVKLGLGVGRRKKFNNNIVQKMYYERLKGKSLSEISAKYDISIVYASKLLPKYSRYGVLRNMLSEQDIENIRCTDTRKWGESARIGNIYGISRYDIKVIKEHTCI